MPRHRDPISPHDIRRALGHFTTGVTVVTTRSGTGEPVGTTASAVSALSLDPPLLLVCLDRASETLAALTDHGRFAVNVLSEAQRHLSENFALRGDGAQWDDVVHRSRPGDGSPPHLDGVLATIDCTVEQTVPGGDHEIVVGAITELELGAAELTPLLHFRGAYAGLAAGADPFRRSS